MTQYTLYNGFYEFGDGSNLITGTNPPFAYSDFIGIYPQFGATGNGTPPIPQNIVQMYIDFADACLKQARWQNSWTLAMGWFVAHFCTLYLESTSNSSGGAAAAIAAGQAKGIITSKSVGDVSAGIDYNTISQDLDGWAAWKLTVFGQQLATIGKLVGKGGMYVW